MTMKKLKVLIVEDEEPILQGLTDVFVYHGYDVVVARDGEAALELFKVNNPDLLLLDVMIPKINGFDVCNKVRSLDREQPIILLTAKTTDEDIITGLTLGADDYIAKPFSVRELILRAEAVLRRSKRAILETREIRIGEDLIIDRLNLVGRLNNIEIEFTRREIEILDYLLLHRDRPVGRGELLTEVWGYKKASEIETRTVDIHIAKLRKKIEPDAKEPKFLVTIRGEGYKLLN
jgi:DNA-binding response OmpR family regulator